MGLWLMTVVAAGATEPRQIQPLLEKEIVGDVLPTAEVQRFCDQRVPVLGSYESPDKWQAEADRLRQAVLEKIVYRGEAAQWRDAPVRVEWLDTIAGGPGYRIKKFRYEALPGLWIPGLLYEPEQLSGKVPAILNVNGHVGPIGKAYVPKQIRSINQAKRGMLAMNVEWIGMGQLTGPGYSHATMNQIDLCGSSGLAPFYLGMARALDILLSLENTDPQRVAVTGLSGGGWQTIVISSLDTRVKLSTPVAGYSSFRTRAYYLSDLGDSEQTPNDLATIVDYTHLTAMMAPRPTLLIKNAKDDCCFAAAHALPPLLEAAAPVFKLYGRENALQSHVNDDPGTHNYELDNRQAFYRMVGQFFYAGDSSFDPKEIPSDSEVKSKEELTVPIPEGNENFNTLAKKLCQSLPRDAELPADPATADDWQSARRTRLREIVHAKDYEVQAIDSGKEEQAGLTATRWRLQMGGSWTVPAVELTPRQPKGTAILVADEGRKAVAADAARLVDAGYRVLAVDPFYFGESKFRTHDYLFALLVCGVGERPLGLQASQVAAIARWAESTGKGPVSLVAIGPRASTYALVAAALEPKAIGQLELHQPLGSLKEVIEGNWPVSEKPELFCFGLLEAFDVRQIAALVAPRPLKLVAPSDRAKAELSTLGPWFERLGGKLADN
jgi:dienelactone hydrolase